MMLSFYINSVLITYLGSFKPSLLESPSYTRLKRHVPSGLMYLAFPPMHDISIRVKDALRGGRHGLNKGVAFLDECSQ